jgi:hypothetical protein
VNGEYVVFYFTQKWNLFKLIYLQEAQTRVVLSSIDVYRRGHRAKTMKSLMSYAVKRPPSVWLVVIRTNVFLPYNYTLHVCRTFILYWRRLTGRRWLGSMKKTMIGEECLPSTLKLCILLRKGPWTT